MALQNKTLWDFPPMGWDSVSCETLPSTVVYTSQDSLIVQIKANHAELFAAAPQTQSLETPLKQL